MSNITVSSNPAGTATFTLASPATNTNRTLTLPDATGTLLSSTYSGLSPVQQYYRLNSTLAGATVTTGQSVLGVGVTVESSTVYEFEVVFGLSKTAGTTSHTVSFGMQGTATLNNIMQHGVGITAGNAFPIAAVTTMTSGASLTNSLGALTPALTSANQSVFIRVWGTVNINAGGTLIPQYFLSAAPGGAYTTQVGSYMSIYPVAAAGTVNIGTWA